MALTRRPFRLAFLGCGHIGSALLGAVLPSVAQPQSPVSQITVALNNKEAQMQLQKDFRDRLDPESFFCGRNVEAVKDSDAVLFAFPPEKAREVLGEAEMRNALRRKLIISILARTPRAEIARILGENRDSSSVDSEDLCILRAMPTMGTKVYESATLMANATNPMEREAMELGTWIFNLVGKVFPVDHSDLDAATGMSAFSNALTTVAVQNISQQAAAEGVPKDLAIAIASQCIRGMVGLLLSGTSPEKLQWSLSAPASITGQAISRLEDSAFPEILQKSLSAAIARAKEQERE